MYVKDVNGSMNYFSSYKSLNLAMLIFIFEKIFKSSVKQKKV